MKQLLVLVLCLSLIGCVSTADTEDDNFNTPASNRAVQWTRNNAIFLSGINISMGAPTPGFVNTYYNLFHATAVHLWADGLPAEADGWAAVRPGPFRFVSWLNHDGTSFANGQTIGGKPANTKGRIGFQIGDEPGRGCTTLPCAVDNLNRIAIGVNAVRAADPNALVIVNFKRSDFLEGALDHYTRHMDGDIISYSHYSYGRGAYKGLETVRRYGRQFSMPYWCYLKAWDGAGGPDGKTASDMRWNAYSCLLYGFSGFSWFTYQIEAGREVVSSLFRHPGDFTAGRTGLWNEAARINVTLQHLGNITRKLISTAVRFIPAYEFLQPRGTTNWFRGSGDDQYITSIKPAGSKLMEISVGFFQDDGGKVFFMVQNVSHTNWLSNEVVDLADRGTIRINFDFSTAPATTSKSHLRTVNKGTGRIELLPLTHIQGNQGYLDITLNPGDVSLLWYDTNI
ncbi:MAG: hypothetical protein DSY90_04325 [Deltaproteobacteria bacterium]|nr:MAG: hypothetical protein DSY90_04325 [Deltaproteobacteria bacterium]